jgi:hypothetical protein
MRAVIVMTATLCGTATTAGAELSGNGRAILDVDRFSMETSPGRSGMEKDADSHLATSTDAVSARARLRARTRGTSRFELGIELRVPAPARYHEHVDDDPTAGGLLAIAGPGTLSIHADALGLMPGASVRVTETGTNLEMLLELGPQETMLELQLEPGTYRILIEGTLDAGEIDRQFVHGRNLPAPGVLPVLALLAGCARVRRR